MLLSPLMTDIYPKTLNYFNIFDFFCSITHDYILHEILFDNYKVVDKYLKIQKN